MTRLDDSHALLEQLRHWADSAALRDLDLAFARFIHQELPDSPASVLLAAALVSERNGHGHVCLDLVQALQDPSHLLATPHTAQGNLPHNPAHDELAQQLHSLSLQQWLTDLAASPAVTSTLHTEQTTTEDTPLVLAGSMERPLLYLRRYWRYEQQILNAINDRLHRPNELPEADTRTLLEALFAEQVTPEGVAADWQKIACLLAARSHFSIITGGPGTGKTTTVVRLLALLQGLQLSQGLPLLHIRLAAPTGKAAARLSESIIGSIAGLKLPAEQATAIKDSIPKEVTTLHRLLGSLYGSRKFRHNAANPLPVDLVVVDEASMMDVDMMARLTDALPAHARLILLGDKDQLASVEAGSVLADLCLGADQGHYQRSTTDWIQQVSGEQIPAQLVSEQGTALHQTICMLRHSYRFSAHPGIGALASQINSGTATPEQISQIITAHPDSLHALQLPPTQSTGEPSLAVLERHAVAGYGHYLKCLNSGQPDSNEPTAVTRWAEQVFTAHNQFQLLAAVRKGPYGVDNLNKVITAALQRSKLLPVSDSLWYHGRPVMVTRNDYSLKLMNGDIGICMLWPDQSLRVAFQDEHGSIRWILPSRLQDVETVFAMTVHKSQGSEFTHTSLVLPDHSNPVLTKELLYTAVTRSKEKFTLIFSDQQTLATSLNQAVRRESGLNMQ